MDFSGGILKVLETIGLKERKDFKRPVVHKHSLSNILDRDVRYLDAIIRYRIPNSQSLCRS